MSAKGWIGWTLAGVALVAAVALGPLFNGRQPASDSQRPQCLDCHRQPNINTNEGIAASRAFCTGCHQNPDVRKTVDDQQVSMQVTEAQFADSPHRHVACVQCHSDVARSPHISEAGAGCLECHPVHGESTAHAPHLRVDCQACHFTSKAFRLDAAANRVRLARVDSTGAAVPRTDHRLADAGTEASCARCHNGDNRVGAPAAVLPAKSLLCIACHPATLSVGHPLFWAGLLVLALGVFLMLRFWLRGTVQGEASSLHRKISLGADAVWQSLFSRKLATILKITVLDIVLQRRILKESVQRWAMHALIFWPILLRCALSLFTMAAFAVHPHGDLARILIDKNSAFAALFYDMTGFSILVGVVWAMAQRFIVKPAHVASDIQDNVTLAILGCLVLLGFLTTGARLLLTQVPAGIAGWSFVGYPFARALALLPLDWRTAYPYLWYAHAAAGAVFVAYLPFGKLKHIFNVPLTYYLEELSGVKKPQRI